MKTHTIPKYLIHPQHPITVNLVGCGGTGSQMVGKLAQIDHALKAGGLGLGAHPGLQVFVFDGDEVSGSNIGRQGFFAPEIGQNKAVAMVARVNRAYGLAWEAIPMNYDMHLLKDPKETGHQANIIISCVDSAKARIEISKMQGRRGERDAERMEYYWLDMGNARHEGQVILGTLQSIPQPPRRRDMVATLPHVIKMFPNIAEHDTEDEQGGSCSVAESLFNQDLCINSMIAEWGKKILWQLFQQMQVRYHGVFVNLQTLTVNPIPIKADEQRKKKRLPVRRRKAKKAVRRTARLSKRKKPTKSKRVVRRKKAKPTAAARRRRR